MQSKQILIVEDDEGIRAALSLTLEMEGFPVTTAANGKEALAILQEIEKPCLILLDLMMPVMNGREFAEALGKDMILAAIPIVIVTAFSEQAKTMDKGYSIIKKPVDIDLLLALVRKYCETQ